MNSRGLILLIGVIVAVTFAQQISDLEREMEKRKSAYMRFGRSDGGGNPMEMEKRKSAYMRFGKRSSPNEEEFAGNDDIEMAKRKSAYMRFGKRSETPEDDVLSAEK
uniref:Uncharacterized protein n=1 Tax=Caenorhabditis japonica TaxID=281687 RepID=A0A8R1EMS9_CAEJA